MSILNLEKLGTQFQDSESAQHNLEITQIPRLCGTNIHHALCLIMHKFNICSQNAKFLHLLKPHPHSGPITDTHPGYTKNRDAFSQEHFKHSFTSKIKCCD